MARQYEIVGIIENESYQEKYAKIKKARFEKVKDPALKAKYQAKWEAEVEAENQRQAREDAKISERVRKKVLLETYRQFGISEEELVEKLKKATEMQNKVKDFNKLSPGERLKYEEQIVTGLSGAAKADGKEALGLAGEVIAGVGGVAITAAGGIGVVGPAVLGPALYGEIAAAVIAINAIPFVGQGLAVAMMVPLIVKILKKRKAKAGNIADESKNLDEYMQDLKKYAAQLAAIKDRLERDQAMLIEKYKTLPRKLNKSARAQNPNLKTFDEFLKEYVSEMLSEIELSSSDFQLGQEEFSQELDLEQSKVEQVSAEELKKLIGEGETAQGEKELDELPEDEQVRLRKQVEEAKALLEIEMGGE